MARHLHKNPQNVSRAGRSSRQPRHGPQLYTVRYPLDPSLRHYRVPIESGQLKPVGVRSSPLTYLRETWDRRGYIWKEAQTRARTQNAQHRLGVWWLVLKPTTDAVFYWVLFALLLKTSRGMENYTAYIIIGVLMFQYFAAAITGSSSVMKSGRAMMRAFSFPRLSIPLSFALRSAMNQVPVVAVILVGIVLIPPHAYPAFSWVLLVPLFGLCFIFNLGVTLLIARIGYVFPDLHQFLGVLTRFLMYGSAVLFPIEQFINHPLITQIVTMNPIYIFLNLFRVILIDGTAGAAGQWLAAAGWSCGVLVVGFFVFWSAEEVYNRELN